MEKYAGYHPVIPPVLQEIRLPGSSVVQHKSCILRISHHTQYEKYHNIHQYNDEIHRLSRPDKRYNLFHMPAPLLIPVSASRRCDRLRKARSSLSLLYILRVAFTTDLRYDAKCSIDLLRCSQSVACIAESRAQQNRKKNLYEEYGIYQTDRRNFTERVAVS